MLLSKLDFCSFLSYTPRAETEAQKRSKSMMYTLKGDQMFSRPPIPFSLFVAREIREKFDRLPLGEFFGSRTVFVPVPRSSLMKPGTPWVPKNLADALLQEKLGSGVMECIKRIEALPKAAFSLPGKRPKAEDHYRTQVVEKGLRTPTHILLVDDIITSGATLLGAASLLASAYPEAKICGFAVMRAINNTEDFRAIEDPRVGTIKLRSNGFTVRFP